MRQFRGEVGRAALMSQPSGIFGAVLRARRIYAGLSQQELSERAAVSVRAVRDIERGRVQYPRSASVRRLALAVGLDPVDAIRAAGLSGSHRRNVPALEINVLGPLIVRRRGQIVEIRSPMQRNLLGVLATQPDQLVGDEELIDVLWGERPPATCRSLMHTHVARLRRLLDPDQKFARSELIVAVGSGYRLRSDTAELDIVRFDELTRRGMQARTYDRELARMLLSDAVECWRGSMLADLGARVRQRPVIVAAGNRRVNAVLALADLADDAGGVELVVEQLRAAAELEPLHEGVHARLMIALARAGQQAAALRVFTELRDRLVSDLGVDPGNELRAAHARVLHLDTEPAASVDAHARSPTPAQLPADIPRFKGRRRHLHELDELLAQSRESGTTGVITAIAGMAGVGKTALATHWAHRVANKFDDGQLYVNLNGYAIDAPLEPPVILARLLGELGVPPERVPADVEAAAALYRTRLADKRMLILLDNARDAEHVRPLLPGSGTSVVIITSRDELTGLVATHGVRRLSLDVLTLEEAVALLRDIVGPERVAADPEAASDLARACGLLPLALRIAAAQLAGHPRRSIREYLGQLRSGSPLAELAVDGDPHAAVAAAFATSYLALPAESRRLFRLLGAVPGPSIGVSAAVELADRTPEAVGRMLESLAKAHLIEHREVGRYGMHDLVRLYAQQQAEPDRVTAFRRLLDHYLHIADSAASTVYPELLRLPIDDSPRAVQMTSPEEGMRWLHAERDNLVAAVHHTAEHGPPEKAWQLADALHCYFFLRGYAAEWPAVAQAGLNAAIKMGNLRAQAASYLSLGRVHQTAGLFLDSVSHYRDAIALARAAGWTAGESEARSNLAVELWWTGDVAAATDELAIALSAARQTDDLRCLANVHFRVGLVYRDQGRLRDAADHQARARELYSRLGSKDGEAHALGTLGMSTHELGQFDDARAYLAESLILMREIGDRRGEAYVLRTLAALNRDSDRQPEALADVQAALTLAVEIGHRSLEAESRNVLGSIHERFGNLEQAKDQYMKALSLAGDARMRASEIRALLGLSVCHKSARPADALDYARQARDLAHGLGFRLLEGWACAAVATCQLELCQYEEAEHSLREAIALHSQTGHRLGHEHATTLLRRSLSARRKTHECGGAT